MNSCENLELNAYYDYKETLRMKTQPRHRRDQRDCPSKGIPIDNSSQEMKSIPANSHFPIMAETLYKDYSRVWENQNSKSGLMECSLAMWMRMATMICALH